MATTKPYEHYKPSGLDWLPQVPDHWDVRPLKATVRGCINGLWGDLPKEDGTDLICVRVADFDRQRFGIDTTDLTVRSVPSHLRGLRLLEPGDLLLEKSGGGEKQPVGAVVQVDGGLSGQAICSNFIARMPVASGYHSRFLTYLHAELYGSRLNTRSIKQSTGIQNLDSASYLSEPVPIPPPPEQRLIAAFLDRETAKIDNLIEQKQRLVELLQEKRTALITQAVTKGLDPDVEMKDSGVEWLSDIPVHWGATRLKFLTSRIVDGVHNTPEYVDSGIPFVTVKNLTATDEGISFDDVRFVSEETHAELTRRVQPRRGDVLLTKDGTLGIPRVVDTDRPFSIFVSVALLKVERKKADPTFLRFTLEADSTTEQFRARTLGSALTHLHLGQIANVYVSLPPLPEQVQVVCELEEQLKSLASTMNLTKQAIDLLHEYRTALISAAVTGKIDVRETSTSP